MWCFFLLRVHCRLCHCYHFLYLCGPNTLIDHLHFKCTNSPSAGHPSEDLVAPWASGYFPFSEHLLVNHWVNTSTLGWEFMRKTDLEILLIFFLQIPYKKRLILQDCSLEANHQFWFNFYPLCQFQPKLQPQWKTVLNLQCFMWTAEFKYKTLSLFFFWDVHNQTGRKFLGTSG